MVNVSDFWRWQKVMLKTEPINRAMSGCFHFITHENTRKLLETFNFLVYSEGTKWERWLEMGSDNMDLPLPKSIRLKGFYISRIFVYEPNIGMCGLVFCIQFKCGGKVIHNPGKIW